MSAPVPAPGRFKPLRGGLVELFLYEAQEFPFRDGRLLLRGDNGSGKSKVLALTLPLLFDADLSPARVEPDADAGKRMAWNLLLGDEHEERTGYSWIEFGRLDDQGDERIVTLGLGMKAVRQRGVVKHWWFITDQRIGEDLHLVDRTRTVRTRERLAEAIGERGAVFDTKERYRRAVDEALFGLHARYDALVDLLVQLRQPQLSKRPNAQVLDRALTEALAPVPSALIDTVAESYQALEDEERAVARLRQGAAALAAFTEERARYARVAARRATTGPRRAQSEYEDRNRRLRDAERTLGEADGALAAATDARDEAVRALAELRGEREALALRQASKEQLDLTASRELSDMEARSAGDAARALERARSRHERADQARAFAAEREERETRRLADARVELVRVAGIAGISLAAVAEYPGSAAEPGVLRARVAAEADRRRRQIDHVRELLADEVRAASRHADAEGSVDAAAASLAGCEARVQGAEADATTAARAWLEATREHLGGAVEVRAHLDRRSGATASDGSAAVGADAVVDVILERSADWTALASGDNPVAQWARAVRRDADAELALDAAATHAELRRIAPLATDLETEIAGLEGGGIRRPPAPHTRASDRGATPGAAFWECVDPLPDLAPDDVAGFEAALEAAGILDAWVAADGTASDAHGDVVLRPAPVDGPTLVDLMRPTASDLPRDVVDALLRSVSVVERPVAGTIAVSTRGGFALGPLVGEWSKDGAEYLGAPARERARLARLEIARAERDALADERRRLEERAAHLAERGRRLAEEVDSLPPDAPVRDGVRRIVLESERRTDAAAVLAAARTAFEAAAAALESARDAVTESARDYAVDTADLAAVSEAVRDLPRSAREVGDRAVDWSAANDALRRAADDASRADEELGAAGGAAIDAEGRAASARRRYETLDATAGIEAREIERLASDIAQRLTAAQEREQTASAETQSASNAAAVAGATLERVREDVDAAARVREEATEEFRRFASTGLLALAAPEAETPDPAATWAPDPTVRLARRVAEDLGVRDVEPEEWDRASDRMGLAFDRLQVELSAQGRVAASEHRHDVIVVSVRLGSEDVAPERLAADLATERDERERLLTQRERAILETHLIDEVGAQLHERVRDAHGQVDRMNSELERRPTRSGLRLRIRWLPGDDELDREGTRLLQQSAAAWSPADREAVGDYLRGRISAARADDPDGSWHERLTRAFDYRAWNRFSVELHQNGGWRPASGPASGGERVLAASVPLFAAAASHYASAGNPHAPRLILLDEAFAGVDDRSRASYLGLLTEFDLDVVMTSEREWATYPEIPGIAIAHLFRLPGASAVHVEHWTWDGVVRERVPDPGTSAIESAPAAAWSDDAFDLGPEFDAGAADGRGR
ncbi:TIGR02680 family protein [Galbitalea sp. SE-J8]|uniref:TIGR02680 family protein n=1 Tax=Galbitalea sp. SE-J8 TaxID=3054952 RepID=UPI00259C7ABE|nr:TIGR02680 family protein [Galbitalea sp. SE-J8]MDM4764266.1 TIGR02680 family protein [Galbitalea sp. SE-J8]